MQDGGYTREEYWGQAGLDWLRDSAVDHPELWQRDPQGHWHGVGVRGAYDLAGDEPVSGINYFEASAYARWAGGKLPHEYQWEVACRLNMLHNTGRAWEWCENAFHPYAGFNPFPYDEYSTPWFDGNHYTLKGGSLYTRPQIKRPSFRNFYQPDKRHIFAGTRLVY